VSEVLARTIRLEPLTAEAIAPFGDVIEAVGEGSFDFNRGKARRHHDLARTEVTGDGRIGVSIGRAQPYRLPVTLDMVERHPLGSQAFVPMGPDPFIVVVAPDEGGRPGRPRAFITAPGQGVNYLRNVWHGVLTPLDRDADFLIVDRIGTGVNLEEHFFEDPWTIVA
jgi:ureidoglycolate lyase